MTVNEQNIRHFENYPLRIRLLSNAVSLGIYTLGFLILLKASWIIASFYLVYILILEFRLLRYHCTSCYYWGKNCGFAKGRISACFFRKKENFTLNNIQISWFSLIPDILVSLIPLLTGSISLILKFNWFMLIAIVLLFFLTTSGNGFIRGKLTCTYCKQRETGCPAFELFNSKK